MSDPRVLPDPTTRAFSGVGANGYPHFQAFLSGGNRLTIVDAWGACSHAWGIGIPKGQTLEGFIAETASEPGGLDYLAKKLVPPAEASVLDVEATVQELRRDVLRDRRGAELDRGQARELWRELDDLFTEATYRSNLWDAFEKASQSLRLWVGGDLAELAVYRPSMRFEVMRDRLLPVLAEKFRVQLTGPAAENPWERVQYLEAWKAGAEGAATIAYPPREGPHTEAAYVAHRDTYAKGPEGYRDGADVVAAAFMATRKASESA